MMCLASISASAQYHYTDASDTVDEIKASEISKMNFMD